MTGTLINVGAVIVGSLIGMSIRSKLPERVISSVFQAIGLFTLIIGVFMGLKTNNFLIVLLSLISGVILGELLNIEKSTEKISNKLKNLIKSKNEKFNQGLMTAFLLYCMGTMAILGAIDEGIGNGPELLILKSVMDGISSIALASAFGIGVLVSALPLLIYQGSITLFASFLENYLTEIYLNELTAVGGIILLGLALNILEIKKIKIMNMIPALVFVFLFTWLFSIFNWLNT
ncbi:MAG: DUF554 domain-containing protein [Bacteroidales bacterium]|nr:DUF554 domain-containing protein [Bacteroidales bacterium]